MKRTRYLRIALIAALLSSLVSTGRAQDIGDGGQENGNYLMICNGCSDVVYRARAREAGDGDHYIYDFTNRKLAHLQVSGASVIMRVSSGAVTLSPPAATSIRAVPLTKAEMAVYQANQNYYDSTGGTLTATGDVVVASQEATGSGYWPDNAFGVANTPAGQEAVGKFLGKSYDFFSGTESIKNRLGVDVKVYLLRFINEINGIKVNNSGVSIAMSLVDVRISAHFPDGSYVVFRYDPATNEGGWVYIKSYDKAGNPIPEKKSDVFGEGTTNYVYPTADGGGAAASQMIDHIKQIGLGVTYGGGGTNIGSGSTVVISCTAGVGCIVNVYQREM